MAQKTREQQDFYDKMLRGRAIKPCKKATSSISYIEKETKITDYMRNCIFWIEQHLEGEAPYFRFSSAVQNLKQHIKECHKLSKG